MGPHRDLLWLACDGVGQLQTSADDERGAKQRVKEAARRAADASAWPGAGDAYNPTALGRKLVGLAFSAGALVLFIRWGLIDRNEGSVRVGGDPATTVLALLGVLAAAIIAVHVAIPLAAGAVRERRAAEGAPDGKTKGADAGEELRLNLLDALAFGGATLAMMLAWVALLHDWPRVDVFPGLAVAAVATLLAALALDAGYLRAEAPHVADRELDKVETDIERLGRLSERWRCADRRLLRWVTFGGLPAAIWVVWAMLAGVAEIRPRSLAVIVLGCGVVALLGRIALSWACYVVVHKDVISVVMLWTILCLAGMGFAVRILAAIVATGWKHAGETAASGLLLLLPLLVASSATWLSAAKSTDDRWLVGALQRPMRQTIDRAVRIRKKQASRLNAVGPDQHKSRGRDWWLRATGQDAGDDEE